MDVDYINLKAVAGGDRSAAAFSEAPGSGERRSSDFFHLFPWETEDA